MAANLFIILTGSLFLTKAFGTVVSSKEHPFRYDFETIQTVPGTSSLENLAIRYTGDILVTSTLSNVLHQVSPDNNTAPIAVAEFGNASALTGIVEIQRDVFYVAALTLVNGIKAVPESNRLWQVDMRCFQFATNRSVLQPARVSLIGHFPAAGLFNGMSRLAQDDEAHLLVADSAGSITKINVHTGKSSVFANDPTMAPLSTGLGLGINGIHVRNGTIYYTSLDQGLFASISFSNNTGLPVGPAEIIATGIVAGDDFSLSTDGRRAFIANNGKFTVTEVNIPGKSSKVVANSTYLQTISATSTLKEHRGFTQLYFTGAMNLDGNTTIGRVVRGWVPNIN